MPKAHADDELLVAQAQRGDVEAFGLLAERHQDGIFNGILRMVGQREDAEDLAQETFVKAFRGIASFEGRSSFYTWLYSIAIHLVISHRRKTGSSRHPAPLSLLDDEDGAGFEAAGQTELPETAAQRHELQERIDQAIETLEGDYRRVIVMRDIEGFDYQTIARLLRCPQGTVKSRVHRARVALREQLKDLMV